MKLEKISYVMPSDVHRLINNEAMVGQFFIEKKNLYSCKQVMLNLLPFFL